MVCVHAAACRCSARAWGSRPRSGRAPAASPWRGRARRTGRARRGGCRGGPANGARIDFCAISALMRLRAAAAVSRLAQRGVDVGLGGDVLGHQVGLPLVGDVGLAAGSLPRWPGRPAPPRCRAARAWRPSRTSWPLSKPSPVTMPATCEATSTPCEAISVPMAGSRSIQSSVCAASAVIVAGGGCCFDRKLLDHLRLEDELEVREPAEEGADDDEAMMKRLIIAVPRKRSAATRSKRRNRRGRREKSGSFIGSERRRQPILRAAGNSGCIRRGNLFTPAARASMARTGSPRGASPAIARGKRRGAR